MKTKITKKVYTFILLLCGMFSGIDGFAQAQTGFQVQTELSPGNQCDCNVYGYGCGSNLSCRMYCAQKCHNHLIPVSYGQNNSTTFSFYIADQSKVSLKAYDSLGRLVSTLANKVFEAGENEMVWKAGEVKAGVYFLQFQSTEVMQTEKLIVTK
jgi:hypothetical protein